MEEITKNPFSLLWEETCQEEGKIKDPMQSFQQPIVDTIVQCRKKHGYNQKEFAQRIQLDNSIVSRMETGKVQIPFSRLKDIASTMNEVFQLSFLDAETQVVVCVVEIQDGMDVYSELGYALETLRKYRGMTQKKLSEVSGIKTSILSRLEKGRCAITMKRMNSICNTVHCSYQIQIK